MAAPTPDPGRPACIPAANRRGASRTSTAITITTTDITEGIGMTLTSVLMVAAALIGIGFYGALSQQSFVMLMMGLELMLNGAILAIIGFWSFSLGGMPEGQLLAIIVMAVMAVEMAVGFALVVAVYRKRQADVTEGLTTLKH